LTGGEVSDGDVEVKWSCPGQEGKPGGDGCVLEGVVMTAEELLERYAAGERDFSGVDLSGVNLEEVCLEDINLEGADLRGTLFFRANLGRGIFRNANLEGADLSMTLLNETDFRGADLRSCNTMETSMIRANFLDAIQEGTTLGGYMYNTVLPDGRVVSDPDPERDRQIAEGYEF
jgi:uncharacterized protein YjbI with pentapeptide repeats